ncbi:hypothetical protein ACIHEJ_24030 [Streptomyces sp. NPDC052301]|uniref:hypothetical protein n=1 Tax=Streptomyces sp. NPDC052301 TaxID=3365687 RepID=UPI0037D40884
MAVAVGGGLTLWLRAETRPAGPYVWENGNGSAPPADGRPLSDEGTDGDRQGCPPEPRTGAASASPTGSAPEPRATLLVCAYARPDR